MMAVNKELDGKETYVFYWRSSQPLLFNVVAIDADSFEEARKLFRQLFSDRVGKGEKVYACKLVGEVRL